MTQAAGATTFEILPPDHPLTQDVPFVVTVLADVPESIIHSMEEKTEDGVAPSGFTPLDSWDGAIHFHESGSHLGSAVASCPLPKSNQHATNGVRQIGPTRFGLYGSRLRTSVAWQATMVLTRSGPYTIDVIPFFPSGKVKPLVLRVAAESHWPASLTRALLLAMLVIVAAVLLVTPARVLPLLTVGGTTALMAWYAVPAVGSPYETYWRQGAACLPLLFIVIIKLSKKPLLNMLLPVRQSGAVKLEKRARERRRNPPAAVKKQSEATLQNTGSAAEAASQPALETGDATAEGETKPGAWRQKLAGWALRARDNANTFVVWLRGPVREEDLLAKQEDVKLAEAAEHVEARVDALDAGARRRSLPEPGPLGRYKEVADGVVSTVEHRAQWQLVIGGACGLAAVVFLLRVSVMFGDAAITAPRSGESLLPLVVRLLPYLLCFVSLLLAAGFLLRQYRASLDDFRHFIRNQRLRESQVAAFDAARYMSNDDDVARKSIEILAWGEASGAKERESATRESGGAGSSSQPAVE